MSMEFEDSLKCEESDNTRSVIQKISTLDLSFYSKSVSETDNFEMPRSTDPILNKFNEIHDNIVGYKDRILKSPDNNDQGLRNELNDRNAKIISVELDFLKQSVSYLQSQLHSKTLEINIKDEKINKLDRVIDKQKRKLKDLKSRVKFQESKLNQIEQRLPKYHDLLEKYKAQESLKLSLEERYSKIEGIISQIDIKKNKFTSSSPKPKNPATPYRLLSPRGKKHS